jgi:hypothetical protein
MFDRAPAKPATRTTPAPAPRAAPLGRVLAPPTEGRPLEPALRSVFDQGFGFDFSSVRIHADTTGAADAARTKHARAFTQHDDVVFGSGQYTPHTPGGRWLLAHELAHIAQAHNPPSPDHEVEAEARDAATLALQGHAVRLHKGRAAESVHAFGEPESVPSTTYITRQGDAGFLNDAVAYHTAWGLRPTRIESVEAIIDDLGRGAGVLDRVRIVMHAADIGVYSSLFRNEGLFSLEQNRLRAWAAGDLEGLSHELGQPYTIPANQITLIVENIRNNNPAVLVPFGLTTTDPAGELLTFFQRVAQRMLLAASVDPNNRAQVATMLTSLDSILTLLGAAVQTQGTASAAQVLALRGAIVAACGNIGLASPGAFVPDADQVAMLTAANRAVAGRFRTRLQTARGRFNADSWIDIRGCRAGDDQNYLRAVSAFFGGPHVSGPNWYQMYPMLGWQTVDGHQGLDAIASDPSVTAALSHWAPITGVRAQLEAWRSYYRYEIERRRLGAAPPPTPGLLGSGLQYQFSAPLLLPPLAGGLTTPSLPSLQLPSLQLEQPSPPRLAVPTLQVSDPWIMLAESALQRLNQPNAELYYYFDAELVLPVAVGGSNQNIRFHMLNGSQTRAMNNWLSSQWRTRPSGLGALASRPIGEQTRVQALTESHDPDARIVFSPDPEYMAHIVSI